MFEMPYKPDFSSRNPKEKTDSMFTNRWSPRSFKKVDINKDIQDAIFDAAHFSPSAFNEQPWRMYASLGKQNFDTFFSLVLDRNKPWAKNASILGFMVAKTSFTHNNTENNWAIYDCGFAWASLAFQAHKFGLFAHAMAGIKYDEVYTALNISKDDYKVVAGFAIGVLDERNLLPEALQKLEEPSKRKNLDEVYFT